MQSAPPKAPLGPSDSPAPPPPGEAVCGRGEWRCGGGQCIPEASRCDLVLDCEDRTDEMNCGQLLRIWVCFTVLSVN